MSREELTDEVLAAWLDEQLSSGLMAAIEKELRSSESLRLRVAALSQRRDEGVHTVGAIWRRQRLSCPPRSTLGSYLLGTLTDAENEYLEFHLHTVACRACLANLDDLESRQSEAAGSETTERRRRIFETSAGYLKRPSAD